MLSYSETEERLSLVRCAANQLQQSAPLRKLLLLVLSRNH
jgi:hypothetical protein